MKVSQLFEHFFKPEARRHGGELYAEGSVFLSSGSDSDIQAFVRGSKAIKVNFFSKNIANETFFVDCSCPQSSKGVFCKHIWATLLAAEESYPDFFDSKKNIEKVIREKNLSDPAKERQATYQKQQYEKQKLRTKEWKLARKKSLSKMEFQPSFSPKVEKALAFFSENGFPMESPFDEEFLKNAKKKLSRVFHPDKGGSHEETVALNENFEALIEFMGNR